MATIGIDVGTSTCAVASLVDGAPRVLANPEGSKTTPSILSRTAEGEWTVGQPARRLAIVEPRHVARDFVRLLGRRIDSPEARNFGPLVPFELVEGPTGRACYRLGEEEYDPVVLVALLLTKLKTSAESALGAAVDSAVLGHPASFDAQQRALLLEAAGMAELPVSRLAVSTSLASLAYEPESPVERVAIVDLGGAGFRIALVECTGRRRRVLATEWELFLGGEDLDQLLVQRLVEQLRQDEAIDASGDPRTLAHLKEAVEKAKCRLSVVEQVQMDVPLGESRLWSTTRRRVDLEAVAAPQLEWLAAPCAKALRSAELKPEELAAVLNIGGATRMPLVLETLHDSLGREITPALHPEEAAALGAAMLAESEGRRAEALYEDVLHHSIGVEAPPRHFAPIAERGAPVPLKRSRPFSTADSRLDLKILEGDHEDVRNDVFLGKLVYEVPFRRGATQIEVVVEVDDQGAIAVSSLDVQSGAVRKIPLRPAAGLSDKERQRARAEVERYRDRLVKKQLARRKPRGRQPAPLTTAEKVMAAFHGDAEARRRLVRDPERAVWSAVIESPKMEVLDALAMAAMDLDPDALREIGGDPRWSSSYDVRRALVTNPRTPAEVSMRFVDALSAEDLKSVAADERLPAVIRDQCGLLRKMRG